MGKTLIFFIRIYQRAVSPLLPCSCRFYPSCSQYLIDAVSRWGLIRGIWKGSIRLLKCQPLHPGGHDPVKD